MEANVQFLIDFLKSLLKELAVRAAIVGAVINGLLYLWSFLASKFPGLPDPSPVFFEIGKWLELLLAGWAASRIKEVAAYLAAFPTGLVKRQ